MALLLVLLVIVLAMGYAGIRGLNAAYARSEREARTLAAMQQAKQALLGYAANRARLVGLRDIPSVAGAREVPGALPCPAATLDYLQNVVLPPAPAEYGRARETCTTPALRIGRFPWRTLEVPQLTDAQGEPLWYAVSGNFRFQTAGSPRVNLTSTGQIRLQGTGVAVQERIVAVIMAPGALLSGQSRATAAERDDPVNYLERFVVAPVGGIDLDVFPGVRTDDPPAFNDQVLTITEEELFDAIDNAIAARLQRDIVPLLEAHRTFWGTYPYGTGFFDPQTVAGGLAVPAGATSGPLFGHLPVATQAASYQSASQFGGTATVNCTGPFGGALPDPQLECTVAGPTAGQTFTIDAVVTRANAALFNPPNVFPSGVNITSVTATSAPGSLDATLRIQGVVTGPPGTFTLDPPNQRLRNGTVASTAPEQWFDYGQWARFVYFARCSDAAAPPCMSIATPAGASLSGRAVLILAGRPVVKPDLTVQQRPSSLAADYLEPPHDTLPTLAFRQGVRDTRFNDRVVVLQ